MAEAKKTTNPKATVPDPVLVAAAESSDPAVHALLAKRQSAVLNGDDEAAAAVDAELAKLGHN